MSRVKVRPIPPHNPVYKDLPDLTKLFFQFPWQIVELDTYTANLIAIGHLELLEEIEEAPVPTTGGAPTDASYLTLTNNPNLTDERVLAAGPGISINDTGPNGTLTISSTVVAEAVGDVVGPAAATDNAVARFDTTTGKLIQSSGVSIDDANSISGVKDLNLSGTVDGVDVSTLKGDFNSLGTTVAGHTTELGVQDSRLDGHDTTLSSHTDTLSSHTTELGVQDSRLDAHDTTLASHTTELGVQDSRLDGHDTTLADHTETLADHSTDLFEHASTLNNHTDELSTHASRLDGHDTVLTDHTATLSDHSTDLFEHASTLNNHTDELGQHSTELNTHTSRLDGHDSTLSSHTSTLTSHTNTLASHTTELGVQDSRLDAHDTTLANHTAELNTQDSRLDAHDTTLSSHTNELSVQDSRLDNHDSTLASHTSTLATHTTDLSNHTSRLDGHDSTLSSHASTLTNHTNTLSTHTTDLSNHASTLASHTTSINDLSAVPYITLSASNATSAERVLTKGGGIDISSTATTATIALDAATTAKLANLAADANAAYAATGHNHDTRYALLVHNHDTLYAPLDHSHPSTGVSFKDLNDNSVYSATEYDVGRGLMLSDGGEGGGSPQLRTNLTSGPGITISGLHELMIESNTVGAAYLTFGSINPYLTGARKLTQGTGITLVDGGAGGNLTINATVTPGSGGFGDVVGPASSIANRIPKFSDTTGKVITQSGITIDSANNVSGVAGITMTGGLYLNGSITLNTAGATVDGIDLTALNQTVTNLGNSKINGPGTVVANRIPKFSDTTGINVVQSGITIDASNNLSGIGSITTTGSINGADIASLNSSVTTLAAQPYVTIGGTGSLNQERSLAVTPPLTITDGGANSTVTLAAPTVVVGPASTIDGRIALFSGTTGKLLTNTTANIDGAGNLTGIKDATLTGNLTISGLVDGVDVSNLNTTVSNLLGVPYITLGTSGVTSTERALVAGNGISIYDNGANSTVTVANTHTSTIDPGPARFPGEGYSERMWIPNWEDGAVHEVGLQMEVKCSNEWYWESRPCTADYPIGSTPRIVYTCPGNYNWWSGIQSKKFQVTRSANGANYGGFLFATRFAMGSSRFAQALFVGLLNYSLEPFGWNNMYSSFGVFRDGTATYQNAYISSTDNNGNRVVHNTIPETSLYNGIDFYVMNPRFSNAFYWGWRDIGANTWNAYGPYVSTLPRSGIDPMRVRFYTCAGNSGQWQFLDIGHTYVRG